MDLAKFTFSILYNENKKDKLELALKRIEEEFGGIEEVSKEFYFPFLENYYGKEMGRPLKKVYLSLKGLKDKGELVEVKLKSIEIEKELSQEGKRTVNLDPGYLDESQLILASHKRRGARISGSLSGWCEDFLIHQCPGIAP